MTLSYTDTFQDLLKKVNYETNLIRNTLKDIQIDTSISDDGRMSFYVKLNKKLDFYTIRHNCKSMIYDIINKTIISYADRVLTYSDDIKMIDLSEKFNNDKYIIHQAFDGSIITIYSFEGLLHLSSIRSYDLNNKKIHKLTFAEMVYDSALTNPIFIDDTDISIKKDRLSWNIPSQFAVTIGFSHPDIHLNKDNSKKIWLISVYDTENKKFTKLDVLDSISIDDNKKIIINDFKTLIETTDISYREAYTTGFYGYILNMKDCYKETENIKYHKVFIPHKLYLLIKRVFYIRHNDSVRYNTNNYKYLLNIFMAVLLNNTEELSIISEISPYYKELIDNINIFFDIIISETHKEINEPMHKKPFITNLIKRIKVDEPTLELTSIEACKVIHDYIKDINNVGSLIGMYNITNTKLINMNSI